MRFQTSPFVAVAALSFVLAGCRGKPIVTARLTGPGTAEVHFRGKPVKLWSDYEGVWSGSTNSKLPIKYDIEVSQNGKSLGKIACDTEVGGGTSVCGTSSHIMGENTGNCEVSLACSLPKLGPSDVTLKVTGRLGDPSRVRRVSLMSLVVREP